MRDSYDPFLLPDMEVAVERIGVAAKDKEKICVWSDYDADGIPGGVMLTQFLRDIGMNVVHYIPHRHKEGYGLNTGGIDTLAAQQVTLIITIDLGTTEFEGIEYAKQKGIDVIVTDHHEPHSSLPPALALINPKRPDSKYPFDGLCGAGVAWKLVQAILSKNRFGLEEGKEKWLLDLVGLATLSDMVPLLGENRMLAHFGLRVIRRARRPGLASLLKLLRINANTLTEDDVGFMVTPRINAASRMDTPETAAALLGASDPVRANELAQQLNHINDERKGVVASIAKEANKRLKEHSGQGNVIVMGNPNWRPGVLGLVANTLAQAHSKPVFLWGREGGDTIRGSVRSPSVSVVELMSAARDVFKEFGGHHASGGFSVVEEKVHELAPALEHAYATLTAKGLPAQETQIDRQLTLGEVGFALRDIERLSPFGMGNSKPLFVFPSISVASTRSFGKQSNHLEARLSDAQGSAIAGMAFFSGPESFTKKLERGVRADIVGHVENDWKGKPRIRIVDAL
jgi:single-stranded-DNA-specific exonuclease